MQKPSPRLLLLALALLGGAEVSAQESSGGGEFRPGPGVCLAEPDRAAIRARLEQNVEQLRLAGDLPPLPSPTTVKLNWPIGSTGLGTPGVHGISNFVDQNPAFPNQILDYNCGARTYDTSAGYNHKGVDIFSWPFGWLRMDQSAVTIVAAAPGTIIGKDDGNADRSCAMNSNNWNAVYVRHADGSEAWYGHMKNGSTTSKAIGQTVVAGEKLGVVGSSGSSTGPHLHLELYDANGQLTEAYSGTCNQMANASSWVNQRAYYDSAINEIATHSAAPQFPSCPIQESPNYQGTFVPGATAYFAAYYRDQLAGQTTTYTILKPDGTVWNTWTAASSAAHYAASYWWWSYVLPTTPQGTWKFRAQYLTQTVDQPFVVGSPTLPVMSVTDPSVAEGQTGTTLLAFKFSLDQASSQAVSVTYATADGTAAAGTDYTAASGTVTFPPGQTSRVLVFAVKGDATVEPSETLLLNLTAPSGVTLARTQATGTIFNDDPPVAATTVVQYRLYHDGTKEHLYSTDLNEYNVLGTVGWIKEGIAYKMLTNGTYGGVATVPLFRAYHPGILQHHWTTDANEAATLSNGGAWTYEGIVGYLVPSQVPGSVPLYRMALANPPLHLWTTDLNEYTVLKLGGWIQEGIIGYVIP